MDNISNLDFIEECFAMEADSDRIAQSILVLGQRMQRNGVSQEAIDTLFPAFLIMLKASTAFSLAGDAGLLATKQVLDTHDRDALARLADDGGIAVDY